MQKILLPLIAFAILLTACTASVVEDETDNGQPSNITIDTDLAETADVVLLALRNKDMELFASLVHAEKGVRFSPYAYVSDESDQQFTGVQLLELWDEKKTSYIWGAHDGSGEPIELNMKDYFDGFVYDQDYLLAPEVSFNERLGMGNTVDNSQLVYSGSLILEYYFPGFEEQYEGLDWASLRLVFEQQDGIFYLIGVIHDQWTS